MEKETIICPECATENEPQYFYCKNCGTPLTQKAPEKEVYGASDSAKKTYDSSPVAVDSLDYFDGIPKEEMAAFIVKKSPAILRKFTYMEICHKKTSWCWPVAVLSFFFGPFGAALWFFYRKMYKIALILAAIGILLSTLTVALDPKPLSDNELSAPLREYSSAVEQENFTEAFDLLKDALGSGRAISSSINNIVRICTLFITSIFAFYWYKKHVISGIIQYRNANVDARYYSIGLSAVGGVSGGMLTVGILLLLSATPIAQGIVFAFQQLIQIIV